MVGGPKTPQQIAAQKRLQQTQAQVDEVCTSAKTVQFICNLLYITRCILGGGYYEDERDEGTGQGSKTLRTG